MREESGPGGRFDPVLVGVLAAAVYVLHGFDGALDHDLGVFVYGGIQVADGVPPYLGIFNSVGPLADAVPGLAIWLGRHVGLDPVLAARLLFVAIASACCALVLVLARETLRSRAAGWVAASAFLAFQEFLTLAGSGPREKTTMVLFLLGALILLGRRRWLGAGACTALATLAWQPVLAVLVVVAAITLASGPRRVRSALAFAAGGLLPLGATFAFYAARGELHQAIGGFVMTNLDTSQPSLFGDWAHASRFLWRGYHLSIWLALAGLAVLVVLAAVRPTRTTVALAGGAATGVAWTTYAVNGPPDLFVLLPFAAVGIAAAAVAIGARLRPERGLALAGLVCVACVNLALVEAALERSDALVRQRDDVTSVLAAAPRGATVLSLDAPQVLALADRRNPTPYQLFDGAMRTYLDHTWPGGLSGYAADVAADHPTLIVAPATGLPPWARPELQDDYRYAGRGPDWTWWISRSAGRAEAADVREANRLSAPAGA